MYGVNAGLEIMGYMNIELDVQGLGSGRRRIIFDVPGSHEYRRMCAAFTSIRGHAWS